MPNAIRRQPNHLVVAAGSTPNANPTNTHLPSFIGETDFFFADATVLTTLSSSNITSVALAFVPGEPKVAEVRRILTTSAD